MILENGSFDLAVTWYYISFILVVNWILLQASLLTRALASPVSESSIAEMSYTSTQACRRLSHRNITTFLVESPASASLARAERRGHSPSVLISVHSAAAPQRGPPSQLRIQGMFGSQVTVAVLVDCFVDASNAADKAEADAQLAEYREARQVSLAILCFRVTVNCVRAFHES
jgi:hypothetical protein